MTGKSEIATAPGPPSPVKLEPPWPPVATTWMLVTPPGTVNTCSPPVHPNVTVAASADAAPDTNRIRTLWTRRTDALGVMLDLQPTLLRRQDRRHRTAIRRPGRLVAGRRRRRARARR